jgi:FkbM family methyltransferase
LKGIDGLDSAADQFVVGYRRLDSRKKQIRALQIAVVLIAAVPVAILVHQKWDHLRAISFHAQGRTGACALRESIQSVEVTAFQVSGTRRMREAIRLVRREASGPVLYDTPRGRYWIPSDSAILRESFAYELAEQERDIYSIRQLGVRAGDTVLDCGAGVGLFTKQALLRGAKTVIAIEPAPENLECLGRNLEREIAAGQVIVYPKGVWDKDDLLEFGGSEGDSTKGTLALHPDGRLIKVPVTTIDRLVQELGLARVNFIKMDIEGAEKQALSGARQTLAKFRPRMAICVYHLPNDPTDIPRLVQAAVPSYRCEFQCLNYEHYIEAEVAHFSER